MAAITLRGVGVVHPGGQAALDGIDLEIADGEVLGIIGPSGAGKTTLLRVIAGLARPSRGRILIDGRDAEGLSLRARDFAYMPQGDSLIATRTVGEQLAFPLQIRHRSRADIRQRVRTEARALGLGRLLGRRPPELSAGEAQRVALGRTRTRVAAAVLLDEPMSRVDAGERSRLRSDLRAYQQAAGLTVVLATNDHDEALVLADRIAVLRDGRLVQVATPEGLLRRPAGEWVAGFLGDPPMGVVDGAVETEGGLAWLRVADQRLRIQGGLPGALGNLPGGAVRVGARPHHLRLPQAPDDALDRRLRTPVVAVVPEGARERLVLRLPGGRWQVRVPTGAGVAVGEVIEVVADVRAMSAFDPAGGRALWHGEGGPA